MAFGPCRAPRSRKTPPVSRCGPSVASALSGTVAWNPSLPLEQQDDWPTHAAFMNALHAEGFVLLGGPLEGTSDVLLVTRSNDANEICARLSARSWSSQELLRLEQIVPWTVRLGSLG